MIAKTNKIKGVYPFFASLPYRNHLFSLAFLRGTGESKQQSTGADMF